MIYKITNGTVIASYSNDKYGEVKEETDLYWIDVNIPITNVVGMTDDGFPITIPNTYTLTYQEKLDSLRFKRGYLLQQTDCGMVTDCPLSEEKKGELATYRQSLRDFSKDVTEENVDTYKLPDAPEWAITWFKL